MWSLLPALLLCPPAVAETLEVGSGKPYASISTALAAVDFSDGLDTIRVSTGVAANDYVAIDQPVVIESTGGSGAITLGSSADESVFVVNCSTEACDSTPVTIRGFTLENLYGSGVHLIEIPDPTASVVIEDVVVEGLEDGVGAAVIYAHGGGNLTLRDLVLRDIGDALGGVVSVGAFFEGGAVTIEDSVFEGLTIDGTAAGAWVQVHGADSFRSKRNHFSGGRTTDKGGALSLYNVGSAVLDGDTYEDNYALLNAGAIYANSVGSLVVGSCIFRGNRTSAGGIAGLHIVDGGSFGLFDNTITEHDTGTAMRIEGTADVVALRNDVCANNAGYVTPTIALVDSGSTRNRWANNVFNANTTGGALQNQSHPIEVYNNIFAQNSGKPVQAFDGTTAALDFRNNLVMQNDGQGVALAGGTADDFQYNWYWSNTSAVHDPPLAVGTNTDGIRPEVRDYRFDDLCIDDWAPLGDGNLLNSGDPSITDPDDTVSDPGIFGGPDSDPAAWLDIDEDGWVAAYDCDDDNPLVFPSQIESCNDIDDDCNGAIDDEPVDSPWYSDFDGDGYGSGAAELACGRPYPAWVQLDGDCKPANDTINPGATETCDGTDNNCSGDETDATDATAWYVDTDSDSYGTADTEPTYSCDAISGHADRSGDCNDDDGLVSPAAAELCDAIDNDCNPDNDDEGEDAETWYVDADDDDYGLSSASVLACEQPDGHAAESGDCDDASTDIHPDATESCDGIDTDCDGALDNGSEDVPWYADGDGDGYGDDDDVISSCLPSVPGRVKLGGDCDDDVAAVFPTAEEHCDGIDENCDSELDENAVDRTSWFEDGDGDGHGANGVGRLSCEPLSGHVAVTGDCDDTDPLVNRDAGSDVWSAIDSDCDGIDVQWALGGAGCSTTPGAGGGVWLALALLLTRRRR